MLNTLDSVILEITTTIDCNITAMGEEDRGLLSKNILNELYSLVKAVIMRVYYYANPVELDQNPDFEEAEWFVSAYGETTFLSRFYKALKIPVDYYALEDEDSVRLVLKYYEYLIILREFLSVNFGLDVLKKLDDYPIDRSSELTEYYEAVVGKIEETPKGNENPQGRYYVRKEHPIFMNGKVYYEITFAAVIIV